MQAKKQKKIKKRQSEILVIKSMLGIAIAYPQLSISWVTAHYRACPGAVSTSGMWYPRASKLKASAAVAATPMPATIAAIHRAIVTACRPIMRDSTNT